MEERAPIDEKYEKDISNYSCEQLMAQPQLRDRYLKKQKALEEAKKMILERLKYMVQVSNLQIN